MFEKTVSTPAPLIVNETPLACRGRRRRPRRRPERPRELPRKDSRGLVAGHRDSSDCGIECSTRRRRTFRALGKRRTALLRWSTPEGPSANVTSASHEAIFVFVESVFAAQTGLGQNPRDDLFGSEIVNVDDEPGDRGVEPMSRAIKVVE